MEHCGVSVGGCLEEEALSNWEGGTGGGPEPGARGDGLFSVRAAVLGSAWKLQPRTKGLASRNWPSSAEDQWWPRSPSALQQERPVGDLGVLSCTWPPALSRTTHGTVWRGHEGREAPDGRRER